MVELRYVRKRKRRKRAAIITAIASMGVAVFIIVCFLGRFVGTFTIALDTGSVKLSLAQQISFHDETSYIRFDSLPPFDLTTFTNLPAANVMDSEQSDYTIGQKTSSEGNTVLKFFKSTFYVRNSGEMAASYKMKINITKDIPGVIRREGLYQEVLLSSFLFSMSSSD